MKKKIGPHFQSEAELRSLIAAETFCQALSNLMREHGAVIARGQDYDGSPRFEIAGYHASPIGGGVEQFGLRKKSEIILKF